jgi:hypothetical protein
MTRQTLFALLVAAALPSAQAAAPVRAAAKAPSIEPLAVSDATVGDAASFGRSVKWLGLLSGYARLSADCTADPSDTSPCQTLAPSPSGTAFDFPDLDTLTIPGRSANSLLCHSQTPVVAWFAQNPSAAQSDFRFRLTPYYRIRSEVLVGLSDPNTGVPYDGVIELGLTGISTMLTLPAGGVSQDVETGTRACIGGLITRSSLVSTYGLTAAQAEQFFRRDVTITLGMRGFTRLVEDASLNVGTRFTGD